MSQTDNSTWNNFRADSQLPDPVIADPSLPLVSIVTPSFNQGKFIQETIDSVLSQDFPNLEYWVIDGGSSDETVRILREYDSDPRFHWVSEPDGGQSDAINKGFARSQGSIFGWICSDDTLLPNAVRTMASYLLNHPEVDMVTGDVEAIDIHSNHLAYLRGEPYDFYKRLTDQLRMSQPGQFVRRETVEQIGPLRTDLHYTMDEDWWFRMSVAERPIVYIPELVAQYRYHAESKTMASQPKFWEEHFGLLDWVFEQLPEERARWERLARGNTWIYYGNALLEAGKHAEARMALWQGLKLVPWRLRSLLVLLRLLDAATGWRTWNWATALKRRISGEKSEAWRAQ